MKKVRVMSLMSLLAVVALTVFAYAETKVQVSNVHLCCRAAVTALHLVVFGPEGVFTHPLPKLGSVEIGRSAEVPA